MRFPLAMFIPQRRGPPSRALFGRQYLGPSFERTRTAFLGSAHSCARLGGVFPPYIHGGAPFHNLTLSRAGFRRVFSSGTLNANPGAMFSRERLSPSGCAGFCRYLGNKGRRRLASQAHVIPTLNVACVEGCDCFDLKLGNVLLLTSTEQPHPGLSMLSERIMNRELAFPGCKIMGVKPFGRRFRQADIFFPVGEIEAIEIKDGGHHPGSQIADGVKGGASATNTGAVRPLWHLTMRK